MASRQTVLILDYGSQYTQLIARRIRECSVYCEIHPGTISVDKIRAIDPRAIILSGGPQSVYDTNSPKSDPALFELGLPVHRHLLRRAADRPPLGGRVERAPSANPVPARVSVKEPIGVLAPFAAGEDLSVWMSHGDRLTAIPPAFTPSSSTDHAHSPRIANPKKKIFANPVSTRGRHTPRGIELLKAFLFDVSKLEPSWTPGSFVDEA